MSRKPNPSLLAHVLLIAVVFVWGTTFVLVKDALRDVSPLLFNFLRMAIAAIVLIPMNLPHLRNLSRQTLFYGALAGLFLATGYQFQTAGLALTSPSKSAFITGLVVVFVPLFSRISGLQSSGSSNLGWNTITGALLAFTGLLLLTTPAQTPWSHLFSTLNRGDVLTLFCAMAFAGHLLTLARATAKTPLQQLATLQIAVAALVMLITLPLGGVPYIHPSFTLLAALAITGVLATAVAFTVQSWAQRYLPPTHTAILLTLEPVFAWLTSFFFLRERLDSRSLTGAILILCAIATIEIFAPPPPNPA